MICWVLYELVLDGHNIRVHSHIWETIKNKKELNNMHSLRFKMSVVLVNCTQIKEWNEIIIRHNTFTKLPKKKTKLKLHWKLCERKVGVLIEGIIKVVLEM